ncbi:MAG: chemotaxis protein CheX [Acidimicrobiales bacterium]|jgi:chemotaxis protein CheX
MLTSETVSQLTQEIWAALMAPEGVLELEPGDMADQQVTAVIRISGEWNGSVYLACSRAAARQATATMFGLPDDELTDDDISDAVRELVNVVGGSIKGLVPGPSTLSLPVLGEEGQSHLPSHLELAHEVRFSWMAEPLIVSVWTGPPVD